MGELISTKEASKLATEYLGKPIKTTNISYLVQYGRIKKFEDDNNSTLVSWPELKKYYDENVSSKHNAWSEKLGDDLIWDLSFSELSERETTKHVHRLHPYKGKFIPQLVRYFLDKHIDSFKKKTFFSEGSTIIDPFMGSGTTLIESNELGLNSIGIDVSKFNCILSGVKLGEYNLDELKTKLNEAFLKTVKFVQKNFHENAELILRDKIGEFNNKYFPNPEYKQKIRNGLIDEESYSQEKTEKFLLINKEIIKSTEKKVQDKSEKFLSKWYSNRVQQELNHYLSLINEETDEKVKNVMKIVLSRSARSSRATTHSDLATLKDPQKKPYYCRKHKKICTPIHTSLTHIRRYTFDTIDRLSEFSQIRGKTFAEIIHGDSRDVDVFEEVRKNNASFFKILKNKKIDGVFTSPPYVGQIDYHEQHAYSYELFNIKREDEKEIGPLYKGQGKRAKDEYVEGISKVLRNISQFVKDDGDFFIVANDKYNLYPQIAEKSGLKIINKFKRPVLNRTERDRQPYAEIIFHMTKL